MTDVTKEMLIEYMRRKGGRVKNVDLVKYFRKHLLYEDPQLKERAREDFKEKVNAVAVIKQEQGEKFLYLKDAASLSPRQSVSPPPSSVSTPYSVTSPPPHSSTRNSAHSMMSSSVPQQSMDYYQSKQLTSQYDSRLSNGGIQSIGKTPPSQTSLLTSPNASSMNNAFSSISSSSIPNSQQFSSAGRRPAPLSPPPTAEKPQAEFSRRPAPVPPPASKPPSGFMAGRQRAPPPPPISTSQPPADARLNGGRRPPPVSPKATSPVSVSPVAPLERRPAPSAPSAPRRGSDSESKRRAPPPRPPPRGRLDSLISPTSIVTLDESPSVRRASPPLVANPSDTTTSTARLSSSALDANSFLDQMTSELHNLGSFGGLFTDTTMFSSEYTPSSVAVPKPSSPLSTSFSHSMSKTSSSANSTPSHPAQASLISSSAGSLLSPSSPSSSSSLSAVNTATSSPSHTTQSVQHLIKQYTPATGNFMASPSSPTSATPVNSSLAMRREMTPPDAHHVHRSHSNASSNVRRRGNLDTLTRRSIQNPGMDRQELLAHRASKTSDDLDQHYSREALSGVDSEPGRDSPMSSEDYYEQVDPVEKEWVHAVIDGRLDVLHRLTISDVSYINRKGFLNGWTPLHWAAKLGNQDMVNVLILSGASVDIKSVRDNGMTPLHLACEAGKDDVIRTLVKEHNASVNARDHNGRQPLDMMNSNVSHRIIVLLRNGMSHRKEPPEIPLVSFALKRKNSRVGATMSFNVPQSNLRRQDKLAAKPVSDRRRLSSFRNIGKSFRRRKYSVARKESKLTSPSRFDRSHK